MGYFNFFTVALFFLLLPFLSATELSFEQINEISGSHHNVGKLTSDKSYQSSVSQTEIVSDIPVTPLSSFFESAIIIRESLLSSFFEKQGGVIADSVIAEQMTQLENLASELDSEVSSSARRFLDSLTQAVEKARNDELDLSILAQNLDDLNILLLENGRFPRLDSSLLCRISEEQLSEFTNLVQEFSQQLESENPDYTIVSDISARLNAVFRLIFPGPGNKAVADFFVRNLNMAVMEKKSNGSLSNNSLLFVNTLRSYSKNIVKPDSRQDKNRFYNPSDEYAEEVADKYSPPNRYVDWKNCYVDWKISRPVPEKSVISGQDWRFDYNVKLISASLSHIQFGSEQNSEFPDVRQEKTGACVTSGNNVDAVWSDHRHVNIHISAIPLNNFGVEYVCLDSEINPKRKMTMGESLNVSNIKSGQGWWNRLGGTIMNPRGPLPAGKYRFTIRVYEGLHSNYTVDLGVIEVLPPEAAVPAIKIAKVEIFDQSGSIPTKMDGVREVDPLLPLQGRVLLDWSGANDNREYQLSVELKHGDDIISRVKEFRFKLSNLKKEIPLDIPADELLKIQKSSYKDFGFVVARIGFRKDQNGNEYWNVFDEKITERFHIKDFFVKNWRACQDKAPNVEINTTHFGGSQDSPLFPEVVKCHFEIVDKYGQKTNIFNKVKNVHVREFIDHLYQPRWENPEPKPEIKVKRRMYGNSFFLNELDVVSSKQPEPAPYKLSSDSSFEIKFESYAFFPKSPPAQDPPSFFAEPIWGRIIFLLSVGDGYLVRLRLYPQDKPGEDVGGKEAARFLGEALDTESMHMYRQWEPIKPQTPLWIAEKLNYLIKKMDAHSDVRRITQYLKFDTGLSFDRKVHKNAIEWKINTLNLRDAAGVTSDTDKRISLNPYFRDIRRNGLWERHPQFLHKNARIGGENNAFYALLLHEIRHAYQFYLKEKLPDTDSDKLIAKRELEKFSSLDSLGKFCLFGNIVNDSCVYVSENEGHIIETKVKKWADIGHGFLVDPVSANYTKNDFNLLPNSKFRAGQPDAHEKGDLKGVHAAVEADATLFEWWFHKNPPSEFPPYEESPSNPPPALPWPTLSIIGIPDGSIRPVLVKVFNKPSDNNYEKIGIEVTIDGKALSLDSPYETSQFTVPFVRIFAYCYVRMGYPNAGYSISSTRKLINARFVGLWGSSKIYGPWKRYSYLFGGVETHPGQAQGWVCYR